MTSRLSLQSKSLWEMRDWCAALPGHRLLLPPIQRQLVWSNQKIVDLWDSIMRGFPIGMFLAHKPTLTDLKRRGRTAIDNSSEPISDGDVFLFDGQQRLAAILLGFGIGPFAAGRRLYVGHTENHELQVIITSALHPFGYDIKNPNERLEMKEIRSLSTRLGFRVDVDDDNYDPQAIFEHPDVDRSVFGQPYQRLSSFLDDVERAGGPIEEWTNAKLSVRAAQIPVQMFEPPAAASYSLFFARVGQGGAPLTDRELLYSLLKDWEPGLHEAAERAAQSQIFDALGYSVAGLRLARAVAAEKLHFGPARAEHFSTLTDKTKKWFVEKVVEGDGLVRMICEIEKALSWDEVRNPIGLPYVLLDDLPTALGEVLLRMTLADPAITDHNARALTVFVLWWLFFVQNEDRASTIMFETIGASDWRFGDAELGSVVAKLIHAGVALAVPSEAIKHGDLGYAEAGSLPLWDDAFSIRPPGGVPDREHYHVLHHVLRARSRRLIAWSQRDYLSAWGKPRRLPYLPMNEGRFDIDHLIPQSAFDGHAMQVDDTELRKMILARRWATKDIAGNLRYLYFSRNRERGNGPIAEPAKHGEAPENFVSWNRALFADRTLKPWSSESINDARHLVFERSLGMLRNLLASGIADLASHPTTAPDAPPA